MKTIKKIELLKNKKETFNLAISQLVALAVGVFVIVISVVVSALQLDDTLVKRILGIVAGISVLFMIEPSINIRYQMSQIHKIDNVVYDYYAGILKKEDLDKFLDKLYVQKKMNVMNLRFGQNTFGRWLESIGIAFLSGEILLTYLGQLRILSFTFGCLFIAGLGALLIGSALQNGNR
jgi:hypothetical protein